MKVRMEVYAGHFRESAGVLDVDLLGDVAGRITCFECGGTGDWPYGPTPTECGPCVDCKGTGKILVSV